jgi:hypothetical protein
MQRQEIAHQTDIHTVTGRNDLSPQKSVAKMENTTGKAIKNTRRDLLYTLPISIMILTIDRGWR